MIIDYWKQWLKIKLRTLADYKKCHTSKGRLCYNINKKYAFILFAADYNNLGDIAITIAQRKFLSDALPEHEIIEVVLDDTYEAIAAIKKLNPQNVIVTLIGGGNNGTLYEFIEAPRRCVLRELRNYRIISFPQTAIFEETDRGRPYLEAFQKLCKRCTSLTLVAREQFTYDFYKENIVANLLLTPDIVFYLEDCFVSSERREDYCALIFRDDKEKKIDRLLEESIAAQLCKNSIEIKYMDTCNVDIAKGREKIFNNYLSELMKAKIAITDRLHGMILCYVTRTPCYVLENNNPKIKSTYDTWLKSQNAIRFYDVNNKFATEFEVLKYDNANESIKPNFEPLVKYFEKIRGKK